LSTHLKLNVK